MTADRVGRLRNMSANQCVTCEGREVRKAIRYALSFNHQTERPKPTEQERDIDEILHALRLAGFKVVRA